MKILHRLVYLLSLTASSRGAELKTVLPPPPPPSNKDPRTSSLWCAGFPFLSFRYHPKLPLFSPYSTYSSRKASQRAKLPSSSRTSASQSPSFVRSASPTRASTFACQPGSPTRPRCRLTRSLALSSFSPSFWISAVRSTRPLTWRNTAAEALTAATTQPAGFGAAESRIVSVEDGPTFPERDRIEASCVVHVSSEAASKS